MFKQLVFIILRLWLTLSLLKVAILFYRKFVIPLTSYPLSYQTDIGVSKNRGTPKWMVYYGKPYEHGWFGGTPVFGNIHMATLMVVILRNHSSRSAFLVFQPFFLAGYPTAWCLTFYWPSSGNDLFCILTMFQKKLQGINISHLGKRKIIFKSAIFGGYVSSLEGNTMISNMIILNRKETFWSAWHIL